MESPAGDRQAQGKSERLVLVSDASTEAERLIASLRVRKVTVRDVPLMLLAGRVEAQKPMLVICDGLAPRLVDAIKKMRQGGWGASVALLLLGEDPATVDVIRPMVSDFDESSFTRPIDVYSVLQRVEEILGEPDEPSVGGRRSMASLPRVGHTSLSAPGRAPTPAPRRGRSSVPQIPPKSDAAPDSVRSEPDTGVARLASIVPGSEQVGAEPSLGGTPVARMSDELEHLLQDAERRLGSAPLSIQPMPLSSARLTPEQELDAILPADVLAALDEPVDLDEDDETSHPTGRNDRPSSMAPRGAPASLFARGMTNTEGAPPFERATGTSPSEENTPVGRAGERRRATSSGSEPPMDSSTGSVLTPVPVSVKTHGTHGSQTGLPSSATVSGDARPDALAPMRSATSEQEQPGGRHPHFDVRAPLRSLESSASDSVAPGTNPQYAALEGNPGSDVGSTAPPHPPRSAQDARLLWAAMDDSIASVPRTAHMPPSDAVASGGPVERERRAPFEASSAEEPRIARELRASPPARDTADLREAMESRSLGEPRLPSEARTFGGAERARSTGSSERDGRSPALGSSERDGRAPTTAAEGRPNIDIPTSLGKGDVVRALARCVRSRYSGALAIEDESGIRRIVMREGDFVMVASGIDGESLVAFLIQRCDLNADAARLTRKLPQFGRHAGAALIAHGYLRQDELWPVLRAHAEWLLGRAICVEQGAASLEVELSARLQAEPAVFGGATGAEVLVEVVRRVIRPEAATEALGGNKIRLRQGSMMRLLSECALSTLETQLVERATGLPLSEVAKQAESADFVSTIYALVELSVLETLAPSVEVQNRSERPPARDGLDDEAVRSRVALRRSLVDEGDYFSLLGVAHDATGYELRHAYLSLRREFEPGRLLSAATTELREDVDLIVEVLDEAYDVLREPARRDRYRRALEAAPR